MNSVFCLKSLTNNGLKILWLTVEVRQTGNEKLEFFVIEHANQILRNHFIETFQEGINLLLNTLVQLEVCKFLNVFILVLVSNWNLSTAFNKFNLLSLSKEVLFNYECSVECFDVILKTPFKIVVELIVKIFQILEDQWFTSHELVQWSHEVAFKKTLIK